MKLIALQTKTKKNFKKNLDKLLELIEKCEDGSFILAPELCLTGFSYDRMDEASEFAIKAKKKLSQNKTIALTFIEKEDIEYYNTLYIFHKGKVIHSQSKHRLFPLGDEPAHFAKGKLENMKIIEIDGIKIATLICFEIRFPEYWLKVLGADLILNPSMWGAKRKTHFETMTKALAIANQCYVLTANSADDNMAKGSGVISPWGDETRDDSKEVISSQLDLNEISKIRKYIDIGLKNK
jgi:predicted amidohydrolase